MSQRPKNQRKSRKLSSSQRPSRQRPSRQRQSNQRLASQRLILQLNPAADAAAPRPSPVKERPRPRRQAAIQEPSPETSRKSGPEPYQDPFQETFQEPFPDPFQESLQATFPSPAQEPAQAPGQNTERTSWPTPGQTPSQAPFPRSNQAHRLAPSSTPPLANLPSPPSANQLCLTQANQPSPLLTDRPESTSTATPSPQPEGLLANHQANFPERPRPPDQASSLVNLAQTDPEKRNIELFDEGQAEIIKAHGLELAQEPDATTTEPQSNPTARSARNWGGAGSGRDLGLELIFDFAIGFLLALGLVMGLLLAISNAAGAQALANQPPTHPELQKLLELKPEKTPPATIQLDALAQVASEVALDLGAKTRYAEILEKLEPVAEALDETFDFEPLVVKKGQLYLEPPVVATLTEEVALIAPSEARGQGLTYRMTRTGRFLSRPPHWRDYLFAPYKLKLPEPEQIHPTLRPTNAQERAIWEKHARLGWRKGVDQAERLFAEALTALTRDYLGALRFWDLANQGLVQGPTIEMVKTPFQSQPGEIVWNATQYKISSPGQFRRDNPPSATIPNSPKKPRRRS